MAQPANDDCVNAVFLTPSSNTTCNSTAGSNVAVITSDYDPCREFSKRNVWYKFTATAGNHIVQVTLGSMQNGMVDIFTGTCANRSNINTCNSPEQGPVIQKIASGLTIGQEYFVAVSTRDQSEEGSFDICILTPPAPSNDNCINAEILQPTSSNVAVYTPGTTAFATQSQPACSGTADDDVWYKFVATQTSHRISVRQLGMQGTAIVELFSGSCGALLSLNCFNSFPSSNNVSGLTVGQEYFFRIYSSGNSGAGTFEVAITSAPQNDECSAATALSPNPAGVFCTSPVLSSTIDATQSSTDCFGSNTTDDDVWYSFTATHTAHEIRLIQFKSNLGRVELFSGSCAALNSLVACNGYSSLLLGTDTTAFRFGALSPGTVYTFRVYSNGTGSPTASDFKLCLNTITTQANDECSGARTINPAADSTYNPFIQPMDESVTSSRQLFCGTVQQEPLNSRDLWFKFVATSPQHVIRVNSDVPFFSLTTSVYSGSCGSLLDMICLSTDSSIAIGNLIPGNTYFYRVVTTNGNFNVLTTVITPTVDVNDECTGAISITPSNNSTCNNIGGNTRQSTHSQAACSGSFLNVNTVVKDLWYSFVANSSSSRIRVTIANQPDNGSAFQVLTGTCGNLSSVFCSTEMFSSDTLREQRLDGLVIGQTYFIRVFSRANTNLPFTICVKKVVPPVNDECSGAINLGIAASAASLQLTSINLLDASQSQAGCAGTADDDVWFSFTATNDSVLVFIDKTLTDNSVIQIFTGSCGALSSMSCITSAFGNTGGIVLATGLVPGTNYLLRSYGFGSFAATPVSGTLRIGLYEPVGIPANDACSNAITLTPAANNDCNFVVGSNHNAVSNSTNCQTGSITADVWYKFVATATTHRIIVEGDMYLPQLQVLNGSCAGGSLICVSISAARYTEATLSTLVIGSTYFVKVFNGTVDVKTTGAFRICVNTPQVPANDNCAGAITLPVCPENSACANSTMFSTTSATASGDISACSGSAGNDDVWFSFTATGKPTSIAVDILNNQHSLQLLQGSCGSLSSMVCNNSRNILVCPPLVSGQTYFLRLFSNSTSSAVRSSFKIKVYETEPVKAIDPLRVIYDTACLGPTLNVNGEFENFVNCPISFVGSAIPGATLIPGWTFPSVGTSDYLNDCGQGTASSISAAVPANNCFGYQEPRNGKGYVGLFGYSSTGVREYIQSALPAPLEIGKKYMVSFYTSLSDYSNKAVGELGVRFNMTATAQASSLNIAQAPQVISAPGVFINDQKKWVNIRGIFLADQAYTHFIIGNFKDNNGTSLQNVNDSSGLFTGGPFPGCTSSALSDQAYYYIDDVVIAEVTGTSSTCLGGTLPVTWLGFDASKENRNALLQWRTVNEFNCRNYEIERSKDGTRFGKIGAVLCYNNSGSNNYSFKDLDPGTGKWFYRIKQVDLDGKFSYSVARSVSFGNQAQLILYPNPAKDVLNMEWRSSSVRLQVTIFDATGKLVLNRSILNNSPMQLDIAALPAGLYHIVLSDDKVSAKQNFIKK